MGRLINLFCVLIHKKFKKMALDQVDVDKEVEYEVKKKDEMSFWEHLDELRGRLIRALIAISVGIIAVFAMGEWFFLMIIYAPIDKSFPTYKFMCDLGQKTGMTNLCLTPPSLKLFTTEVGEVFFKQMQTLFLIRLNIKHEKTRFLGICF